MEKLWFQHYQDGVPHDIDLNTYTSIVALFEKSCQQFSKKSAYENMGTILSFNDINQLSHQFAVYIQSLGLPAGARVAIMLPNCLQYPIVLFAILRAGFTVVNTNPLYTSDEVIHQLNDSGAMAIVVLANFAKTLEKALPHTPHLKHIIITELGDLFPFAKRCIVNAVIRYIKCMIPTYHLPKAISLRNALQKGKQGDLRSTLITHETIALLQYTGGTTGISKGAILTHGNLVANVLQAFAWIKPAGLGENDIIITALPLYHIFSLTANCLTFFMIGASNVLITNPRDMKQFIREICRSKFTVMTGVNTLFNALLNSPLLSSIDFSHVKFALSGGMPLQKFVAIEWQEKTKSRILEAYGLTETSPAVTINPLNLHEYNGSIGLPLPSTEISIRDDNGVEVGLNETGELCVKGPQVMHSYWRRDDETANVFFPDGFLRTGDIAKVDEDGFVYLVDRKKDMILISGFNVYPNEVEQVISMMPGVLEVGVTRTTTPDQLEQVKACVVKRDPLLTTKEIITHCREHLAAYKIPKIVEFYDELPKTNVGKILRRALK